MRISDWSSDVCSSDLDMTVLACERFAREVGAKKPATKPAPSTQFETSMVPAESESERSAESPATPPSTDTIRDEEADRAPDERSEERRVGKEAVRMYRCWWSPSISKKKM